MGKIIVPYGLVGEHYLPILRIFVRHEGKEIKTRALIDSGAATSVFQANIAEHFGINIKQGEKAILQTLNSKVEVYLHKIPVKFSGQTFMCKIGFSEEVCTSFNLLGRDNFFKFFKITFDELNKEIILESNSLVPG